MTNSPESTCPNCGAPLDDAPQGLCPKCVLAEAAALPEPTDSPAGRTPPPALDELAPHFPDLEILELIGAGGMGAVYKARQPKLDRLVALKILSHDLSADPAFAERFNREARVLARLNHPRIVTVFDFGTAGPFCFLLMEFVDGVNLRQAMRAGGFTPAESLALVQDICAALSFAHEEGILHRDIKPENVLIDSRGRVKIADFGIAKLVGREDRNLVTLTLHGAVLGSPHYMAPEQIETPADVDQRADIYSLGVVFYELLTGELPIGRFAPPSERSPMDPRVDKVVMRTLEKERRARYQTAAEVATQVEAITRSRPESPQEIGGVQPPPAPVANAPASRQESTGLATAAAITTGISLLAGLVLVLFLVVFNLKPTSIASADLKSAPIASAELIVVGVISLVPIGVPALLGFILGVIALQRVRRSDGSKRGIRRAMFGTLSWPALLIFVLVGLLIYVALRLTGVGMALPVSVLIVAGITVAATFLMVRTVRRWAMGGAGSVQDHARAGTGRSRGPWVLIAVLLAIFGAPLRHLNEYAKQQEERLERD